jgi:hypothetical protein
MFAVAGVQYRCLENLFSFKVREYRRLVKVDHKLLIRVLSYGSFNVVALPRKFRRHFAVFILSILDNDMTILAFFFIHMDPCIVNRI